MSAPELSIVLPCYNESGNIPEICKQYAALTQQVVLELILVDNGSTDLSPEVFKQELSKPEYSFVRLVTLPKNIGYGHGIFSGLKECKAPVVGYSHADLQCPPQDIVRAYERYKVSSLQGSVLIKGRRLKRRRDEAVVSFVYNGLCQLVMGHKLGDVNAQPKIFPKFLLEDLQEAPHDFSFDLFVLFRAAQRGLSIEEMDVTFEQRRYGQSKWAHHKWSKIKTILKAFIRIFQIRMGKSWF